VRVAAAPGLRGKRRLAGVEVEEWAIRQQVGVAGVAAVLPSRRRHGGRRGRGRGRAEGAQALADVRRRWS
jgi:hypothetical protein